MKMKYYLPALAGLLLVCIADDASAAKAKVSKVTHDLKSEAKKNKAGSSGFCVGDFRVFS
jgi:hypothetical protein